MKTLFPRLSRITLEDWLSYHPYHKEVSSDHYYIELGNDIQHEILHIDVNDNLVGADYKYLSCMLACYFEDIISQTGIWTSFIDQNHRLYGKYLPFYDTSGYEYGDINIADIQFLIWHFCSNLSIQNHLIDPFSLENEEMAYIVYDMLNGVAGQAPRNEDMKACLTPAPDAGIYQIMPLMDYFLFGSYLNHYCMMTLMEEEILKLRNQKGVSQKNISPLIDDKRSDMLFNKVTPLLAQSAGELLANWLSESHPLYEKLLCLSKRKVGTFRYKETTSAHIQMEHIASGVMVEISTTNMPGWEIHPVPDKTTVQLGIVQWNEEWWVAGPVFAIDDTEKLQISKREKFLFAPVASQLGVVRRQEECFLEIGRGNRLAYFDTKKAVFTFIDDVWDLYHLKYGRESMDRKLFDVHDVTFGVDDDLENVVVFFNTTAGLEFYPNTAQYISETGNPYVHPTAEADIEYLLLDEHVSSQFVSHLLENRMIEIETLTGERGYQYIWNNSDFLLRYWKREKYHHEPKLFVE